MIVSRFDRVLLSAALVPEGAVGGCTSTLDEFVEKL